jgi:hypothetical protein
MFFYYLQLIFKLSSKFSIRFWNLFCDSMDESDEDFKTKVEVVVNGKVVDNSDWSDSEDDLVGYSYAQLESNEPNEFDEEDDFRDSNYISVPVRSDDPDPEFNSDEEEKELRTVIKETIGCTFLQFQSNLTETIVNEKEVYQEREVKIITKQFEKPPVSHEVQSERARIAMKEFDERYTKEVATVQPIATPESLSSGTNTMIIPNQSRSC